MTVREPPVFGLVQVIDVGLMLLGVVVADSDGIRMYSIVTEEDEPGPMMICPVLLRGTPATAIGPVKTASGETTPLAPMVMAWEFVGIPPKPMLPLLSM